MPMRVNAMLEDLVPWAQALRKRACDALGGVRNARIVSKRVDGSRPAGHGRLETPAIARRSRLLVSVGCEILLQAAHDLADSPLDVAIDRRDDGAHILSDHRLVVRVLVSPYRRSGLEV